MPRDMGVRGVYLVVGIDGGDKHYISLDWKSTDGITEWWGTEYTFINKGLYFYHFEYDTDWGRGRIFHHSEGKGHFAQDGNEWQQTVYSPDFKTPDSFKGGVMYQIFPDRFYFSGEKKKNVPKDRDFHTDVRDIPDWDENKKFKRWNADFFGGDLKGIEEKLPYIKTLGVTCIYLNPIFEAHSNHRYDTADYMTIDPLLGTYEDFVSLCKSAKENGINIILDGVFSHTGADSLYFNMYNRYSSNGAYNSQSSPYISWYNFKSWRDDYDSWWGFKTLPETNENDEGFSSFIAGEGGVIDKWMQAGAYGFRLDVADELPDSFIVKLRRAVKRNNPNGLLLGEVWEDASNKISYGGRREYFLGDELDSVMNYPFRQAIIDFIKTANAEGFMDSIMTVCENYPAPALHCLMNHLGTHDTERIFSVLGGVSGEGLDREAQLRTKLTQEQYEKAAVLIKQAVILQYTLPGVPSLYYGDELYTEGLKDPFNRTFFPWDKERGELYNLLCHLGEIRNRFNCFKKGAFVPVSAAMGCVCYARVSATDKILVIANNNNHPIIYYLPEMWHGCKPLTGGSVTPFSAEIGAMSAEIFAF